MVGLDLNDSERIDDLKSRRDLLQRGPERDELHRQISRLSAHQARARREALHVWTTDITRSAARIVVIKPSSVKDATKSASGTVKDPGACVKDKQAFNRTVLEQAPAAARHVPSNTVY